MPTLPEIVQYLQSVSYDSALLGLFITAGLIIVSRDWRLLILALLIQYILVGVILSRIVQPDLAVLKVLIGAFICPILFLSAQQVAGSEVSVQAVVLPLRRNKLVAVWRRLGWRWSVSGPVRRQKLAPTGAYFRFMVGLLLILVASTISRTFPLPGLAPAVSTAVYWLVMVGLVVLALTEDPMKAGHGLFTVLTGFGMYYNTLESSLLLAGLWGAVNLLLALAVGYLIVVRGTGLDPEEGL